MHNLQKRRKTMRDSDDTILLRGSPGRECGRGYICCEQQPKQRSSGAETDWDTEKKGPHIFTSRDGFVSFAITKPRHHKRCTYVYPDSQQYSPSFGIPFLINPRRRLRLSIIILLFRYKRYRFLGLSFFSFTSSSARCRLLTNTIFIL